jgi:hypothetical protein
MTNVGNKAATPSASGEPKNTAALRAQLEELNEKIAELAYYKAEARCFEPGHEIEDWIAAEGEVGGQASTV